MYQRIYERFSFPIPLRGQNGRILRHSRATSGSAGLSPSRNRKPEGSTLSGYARNSRKECAGLVAGQVVLTDENKGVDCTLSRPRPIVRVLSNHKFVLGKFLALATRRRHSWGLPDGMRRPVSRGMLYAPNVRRARSTMKKETGNAED